MAFVPNFYPLPSLLDNIITSRDYNIIVYRRASETLERDRHRKIAIALTVPVVDHIDPEAAQIRFEICANQVNLCKSYLTPDEFVELCKKIKAYRKTMK
jgi:hypothetical protein